MADPIEIQSFLRDFKSKLNIWGVVFRDDRGKNAQTLLDLEISPVFREKILKELDINDYSEGPIDDLLNKIAPLWVFGKKIKAKEIYIKISMGITGAQTICISFHVAEHEMRYPLKGR